MFGVLQAGQNCGGMVVVTSKGTSHSWPSRHLKRRVAISKLPPSILIAFPLSRASAIFCRAESSMRPNVVRETRMLSAHFSCSSPSRSLRRMDSASSTVRQTSWRAPGGTPAGLK